MPPLPRAQDLPENIRDLVLYQKHNIAHESFGRDATHLIAALQSLLRKRRGPKRWRALAVAGLAGLAVTGVLLADSSTGRHTAESPAWYQAQPTIAAETATKAAAPSVNIAGPWRDNWGNRYEVEQEGRVFQFSASGPSCRQGYKFNSSGRGTIDGAIAESSYSSDHKSNYYSTFQSSGSCQATLVANGTKIKSTCDDKVCGRNDFLLTRE